MDDLWSPNVHRMTRRRTRAPNEECLDDLRERAAHVAHHQGLGVPPLSNEAADEMARKQARDAMPGQRTL